MGETVKTGAVRGKKRGGNVIHRQEP